MILRSIIDNEEGTFKRCRTSELLGRRNKELKEQFKLSCSTRTLKDQLVMEAEPLLNPRGSDEHESSELGREKMFYSGASYFNELK